MTLRIGEFGATEAEIRLATPAGVSVASVPMMAMARSATARAVTNGRNDSALAFARLLPATASPVVWVPSPTTTYPLASAW